jgi:hypothetical protein
MHRDLEVAQEILRAVKNSGLDFIHRRAALEAAIAVHQADGEIIGEDQNADRP